MRNLVEGSIPPSTNVRKSINFKNLNDLIVRFNFSNNLMKLSHSQYRPREFGLLGSNLLWVKVRYYFLGLDAPLKYF